ncbi:hypothetical protein SETIT_2G240400v2 [Setaria italica]|uniref:Uncharacterized protein n=1 Tax=Setaria italica TaxID=4555 RepID=A0A368Q2R0_SETIT|nr:hypothetical protein SETIT_2G240400v2 [Setaria italica]
MDNHCPLGDVTNTIDLGSRRGCKRSRREFGQPHLAVEDTDVGAEHVHEENENVDPVELKRQKRRDKYAGLPEEEKEKMRAKVREEQPKLDQVHVMDLSFHHHVCLVEVLFF